MQLKRRDMFCLKATSVSDLKRVSECHRACFAKSFSAQAGNSYLTKSLEWFLSNKNTFLFHVECDNKVVGYCGGFQSLFKGDGSTSGMLQYAMNEAVKGVIKKPYLLFHPELIKRYPLIMKNILKRFSATKKNVPATDHRSDPVKIGLVVIGVHPDHRGKGCFELLMQQFEEECKKRRAYGMGLTVKADNARAIAAYRKAGWRITAETKNGVEMFKEISPD